MEYRLPVFLRDLPLSESGMKMIRRRRRRKYRRDSARRNLSMI
jgi:hypothetical protein